MQTSPSLLSSTLMHVGSGLGAVLYQTYKGSTDAVIAYARRSLTKVKSHYPAHKLEFPVLKWAVVKMFHEYL